MKIKLRARRTFLVFSFAIAATLCGPALRASAEPVRIAYTSIAMVYGPLWVTQDGGFFKKHNLDVDLLYIAGGPPSLQALIAGEVAIAFTAGGAVVAANLSGSDAVLLGTTIGTLPFEIWSIPTIKAPEQLKGTKMGVSRIGATTDFVARYVLKKWGLKADADVAIFQTGAGPQVLAALKGGSIQSGVLSTGFDTIRAEADGFVRLTDVAAMGLPYPFGPFATRQSLIRSQPDLFSRFMKSYVEGIHRFKTDRRFALAVFEKYTKVKPSAAGERMYETFANRYVKRVPEATPEGVQTILDEIALTRPLPSGLTPQRFVESRFIKEIADSGFADALYPVPQNAPKGSAPRPRT